MEHIKDKRFLYKTAYSPMFGVFVAIKHVRQDDAGGFIFTCESSYNHAAILRDHLFRENELTRFVL